MNENNMNTDLNNKNKDDRFLIDLFSLVKYFLKRIWIIVLCAVVFGCGGFCIARFFKTPYYASSVLLYVNNNSFNLTSGGISINSAELGASQKLVKTYSVILNNRTTLEEIIKKSGENIHYSALSGMIAASQVDNTEILKISVVSRNPYLSKKLVNCIAEVLPQRVAEIIHGSSVEIVDSGVADFTRVVPSYSSYAIKGFIAGAILSFAIFYILYLLDTTINDEDYITRTYKYPLLITIPLLYDDNGDKYSYYSKNNKYKYYSKYYASKDGE